VIAGVESFEPSTVRDALCGWRLAERAHADGFRVVLCGEGADELFAGYAPLEAAYAEDATLGAGVREQCLASMHRTNLQRVDRCGMRFAVEVREPFLDPAVVSYAMNLDGCALVREAAAAVVGKQPLRRLFDLYPDRLPRALRDRSKIGMHRGSGFDRSQADGPWVRHAEAAISDADFRDGQREHAAYDLRTKEELLYLRTLAQTMDIARVPHLRDRMRLAMPTLKRMDRVAEFLI
jgi:asparagine synthase (glutamine-hydrolysing)